MEREKKKAIKEAERERLFGLLRGGDERVDGKEELFDISGLWKDDANYTTSFCKSTTYTTTVTINTFNTTTCTSISFTVQS